MEYNVLCAIANIMDFRNVDLNLYKSKSDIRIVQVGEGLEGFIRDALTGSFGASLENKIKKHRDGLSWQGSQNNPPDITVWERYGGDAFEVKKVGTPYVGLELNSSYPRDFIYRCLPDGSEDKMVSGGCRRAEKWDKKDMFYVVGYVKDQRIKCLTITHGPCYAAPRETYNRFPTAVRSALKANKQEGIVFSETRELGRINGVDPLRITDLRVRGMWMIKNPLVVFKDKLSYNKTSNDFNIFALIKREKYDDFPSSCRTKIERHKLLEVVKNVRITDPDNISKELNAVLIKGKW